MMETVIATFQTLDEAYVKSALKMSGTKWETYRG